MSIFYLIIFHVYKKWETFYQNRLLIQIIRNIFCVLKTQAFYCTLKVIECFTVHKGYSFSRSNTIIRLRSKILTRQQLVLCIFSFMFLEIHSTLVLFNIQFMFYFYLFVFNSFLWWKFTRLETVLSQKTKGNWVR